MNDLKHNNKTTPQELDEAIEQLDQVLKELSDYKSNILSKFIEELSKKGGKFAQTERGEIVPLEEASDGDTVVVVNEDKIQLETIKSLFGTNLVRKKDAKGNPIKDRDGNFVMVEGITLTAENVRKYYEFISKLDIFFTNVSDAATRKRIKSKFGKFK